MKSWKYILAALLFSVILTACGKTNQSEANDADNSNQSQSEEENKDDSQKIFGEFSTWNLEGEVVTQEIFEQKSLTMVNIWGTFCGPCISEMPGIGELNREYGNRDFQVVGMLCDVYEAGDETALQIVNETQADYQHLIVSQDLAHGILSQVTSVPLTVFLDSEGNMVGEVYMGARDKETWKLIIEQLLVQVQ